MHSARLSFAVCVDDGVIPLVGRVLDAIDAAGLALNRDHFASRDRMHRRVRGRRLERFIPFYPDEVKRHGARSLPDAADRDAARSRGDLDF